MYITDYIVIHYIVFNYVYVCSLKDTLCMEY